MDRRKLLSWFGLGWLVSLIPSSLLGCSDSNPNTSVPSTSVASTKSAPESVVAAPSKNFKVIGTVAQLDKDGVLITSDKQIAIVRDPKNKDSLLAVSRTCTHNGCKVNWQTDKKVYVCPCHDAKFAPDGTVLEEPAKKPLTTYTAKIDQGQVLVSS
ncbi:MAG: ubiquinol-cytochrome c reductase iron-sulfur subunit [Pseudanabaena sp. M090S1SP1A06QC]|jgi:cytochrome b6-f complex iron-sulfur subunit|nr:ubiquinol-cytochrome c reductase iron-sulfur subunit [Pseudanabaena sp. M109S1SP1A06QC]MCA6606691.1 ubiquinol-cytochrome c reductase iron-sulfur subunit [Pseudanabaena sp. M007S1SP1A06QC]MCA6616093.1 ubiquinol-cytochrome c reductase iron-sulfur subunit [Pseudanabaena sp. M090S1SP1A06QC]MCE2976282.1 ubiquinol-cytochrome c reductase iron-sulfur subunit [Pseudanabaena sp. CoA8_M7]